MTDLETAIQRFQKALDATPADHPDRAGRLQSLGAGYGARYQRTGAMADLETAIQRHQEGLDATPADHPDRAGRLHSLGIGYGARYERTRAITDLETAIQKIQEALDATPTDHSKRAGRLHNLGAGYGARYRRTGAIADLETAIQRVQEALDATRADHPDRAGQLHDLGIGYRDRHQRIGAITDLETAIQRYQEALDVTPADHPDRAGRLHSLGIGYSDRYQRKGAMTDLETAIQRYQEALDATPADHPDRAGQLQSLGAGYRDRYRRTGAITDLETAIQRYQEAFNATPADHPDRAGRLYDLGTGCHDRYRRTGAITDLETAIQRYEEALNATPADHPSRARLLHDFGSGYNDRYQRTGAIADLETAIQRVQEALDAAPADHPDRAGQLQSLGTGYRDRYRRTGVMADLETAIQRHQEALNHSSSPIDRRLPSGRTLLALHAEAENWPQAYQAAFKTVSLVPLLTPRFLENSDKQDLLIGVVGLASDATAMALNAAKTPFDAVQVLELGRGVIAGSLNEMRADMSDLQQKHPQLAEEYVTFRDQLDAPTSKQRQVNQRYNASRGLERVIQQIRRLPGLDRFLLAPSEDELKTTSEYGPIVIINVSDYRCDALIIEKIQILALRLPHLHASDIRDRMAKPLAEPGILEWLWKTVAKPVLDTLGFTQTPSDGCWPHIWWIPTGLLAKFPIHAAGYHSPISSDSVLDRAISSYTSSVNAIIHGRRHRLQPTGMPRSAEIVLVAMQKTPEQNDLPFAAQEIHELERHCSSMKLQVKKPSPYKEEVLSALNSCKIFHFAGHGLTNSSDPSKSRLLLEDWKIEPLTVASLLETNLQKRMPFLAYLSACGTGQMKNDELIDEGLHLISACQLAGFQHVIGTLWEVNDKSCVDMATRTYKWMLDRGMSDQSVSEGLHHASRWLRHQWIEENSARGATKRGIGVQNTRNNQIAIEQSDSSQRKARDPRDVELSDDTPLYWVPYVHFGV